MSPEIPAPRPARSEDRSSHAATTAVMVAGLAVTAFGLLGVASMLGWLPKVGGKVAGFDPDKAGAITRPPPGPAASSVPNRLALAPGETLVAEPDPPRAALPTEPLMPRYGDPVVPRPAPPRPVETFVPPAHPAAARPAPAPAPAEAPVPPRWLRSAPDGVPATGIPVRRLSRYAEGGQAETRGSRSCGHCGTVTEVSPYIDQWDVHVRFQDGTRRVLRYPQPPNVSRGDRVVLENGRLRLE
jgi:hypothetical protein